MIESRAIEQLPVEVRGTNARQRVSLMAENGDRIVYVFTSRNKTNVDMKIAG
jgi:hypothetical protein